MRSAAKRAAVETGKAAPLTGMLMGARRLTGAAVYDASSRRIGKIEDIVLDTRTGCVRYAIVALGGMFGIGCRRYAVQWNALRADATGKRCTLNVAHLWLTGSPLAGDSRWPGPISAGDTVAPALDAEPAAATRSAPAGRRIGPLWPSTSYGKL